MPFKAFVLVQLESKKTKEALKRLPGNPAFTMGRFDAVGMLEAETPQALCDQVVSQYRNADGVTRTETLPIVTESIRQIKPNWTVKGYLLLRTEPDRTNDVFGRLASLPEVASVYTVAGRYDLIAQVGASNWEEFGEKILNRIRPIEGIRASETCLYM